ncbi:MAG: arginine--tRNA ligase, partial [bacterium]
MTDIVTRALDLAAEGGKLQGDLPVPIIEMTRDRKFGDYATNIAMVIASRQGANPREVAGMLAQLIREVDSGVDVVDVSVAGPGFINLTMSPSFWYRVLKDVLVKGPDFACSDIGAGKKVQVEFVSANPTGPLHVGHGRGAALGDALANILACAGFSVQREYYINDAGKQIQTLGISVYARYLELCGRGGDFPGEGYKGAYIKEIAQKMLDEEGGHYLSLPEEEAVQEMALKSASMILEDIREDLEEFGVAYDVWSSEKDILQRGDVQKALEEMEERGNIFRHEGAVWFRSTDKGDDKDRVLVKSDGS